MFPHGHIVVHHYPCSGPDNLIAVKAATQVSKGAYCAHFHQPSAVNERLAALSTSELFVLGMV